MTDSARTALIAGATGAVGSALLKQLLQHPAYTQVIALSRRELPSAPKLNTLILDFDALETALPGALAGATPDDVYCTLGTTMKRAGSKEAFRRVDHDYVLQLAQAGRSAGAARFMLNSSVGAAQKTSSFYLRVKGEVEAAVSALDYSAVHIFRPSILLAKRDDSRPGEAIAQKLSGLYNPLLRGGLRKYRAISVEEVARAMLHAALGPFEGVHVHEFDDLLELQALG